MEEILEDLVVDRIYNEQKGKLEIKKKYHIYIDDNKDIHIYDAITPKKLNYIRKLLKKNEIYYKNLIIGYPEI